MLTGVSDSTMENLWVEQKQPHVLQDGNAYATFLDFQMKERHFSLNGDGNICLVNQP